MTKQEFLAISLPYKLKVYVKYSHKPDNSELETMIGIVDDCIITDMHEEDMAPLSISNYGLCLYPLSDYQKIKHLIDVTDKIGIISVIDGDFDFTKLRFDLILKLVQNHFDFLGLIEKGEAIDVNTLDVNPYK